MFLASYIQTLFPYVLGETIDIMKVDGFNRNDVIRNIIYILLITITTFACTYLWRNIIMGNSRNLECYLREHLFKHFQKLPVEFYNKRKTGDLIAYAINDISAVRMAFGPATARALSGIVTCASSIYFMCINVDARLTLTVLIPLPLLFYVMFKIGKKVQVRFKKVQETFSLISDRVQENIYGIRVIKSYVQEDKEIENFEVLNNQMMNSNVMMVKTSSLLSPVIEICFDISFVVSLIFGGKLVLKDQISLGDFIAFNTYLTMILSPIVSIGRVINIIQRGLASKERLNEIFNVSLKIDSNNIITEGSTKGEIEFRNLNFTYPGASEKALEDISFSVPQGHTIGIVGKTGSGKSTLASLLLKLYNINQGEIFLDGKDINDYSLEYIRDSFALVPQDIFLFSATIKDNITFFKDIYTDEEIEKAAQCSCIYNSIMEFPDKFNTKLGERGVNLSGGQKQRVSIARAVIKDPPVLILDDALSAVDTETEAQILKNLSEIRKGKTTIIIAHRISAVENADEIIVLDRGKIREKGSHEELMEKGGLYYEIYMEQSKEREKGLSRCEASC